MTEFNRERILEERSEQKQRLQTARALDDMVKRQQRGGGGVAPGDDSVSRAAKRMAFLRLFLSQG
jgi:RNA polymerase-associated protein RTF1